MEQSNNKSHISQTDEIDLRKVYISLAARKLIIFCVTGFFTLLAIIYVYNLTQIYQATSSFTSPSDVSINKLNSIVTFNLGNESRLTETILEKGESGFLRFTGPKNIEETKNSVFSKFLTMLSSRELQTKVFLDGDYLTAFNPKNNPINDVNNFINGSINSIKLSPPTLTQADLNLGVLTELPYTLSIEGTNAEVISRYLNDLVLTANTETINALSEVVKQKISSRLEEISLERQLLLIKTKQERINNIEILTEAAEIARSLGILETNFKQIFNEENNSNLTIAIAEKKNLPQWYLYGEKALLEKVKLLENRSSDEPFIPELINLDNEIIKLNRSNVDMDGIVAMQLSQAVITSPVNAKKRQIVLLTFFAGLMISILLVLAMEAIKSD